MRKVFLALAGASLFLSTTGIAAEKSKPVSNRPAAAPAAAAGVAGGEAAQLENAVMYLKVLISGLQSSEIKEDAKSAMVGCLYGNSLGTVTESMDKLIEQNTDKVHRDKPTELLGVLLAVCGYKGNPLQPAPAAAPQGR